LKTERDQKKEDEDEEDEEQLPILYKKLKIAALRAKKPLLMAFLKSGLR
jgi:hypothetical protein